MRTSRTTIEGDIRGVLRSPEEVYKHYNNLVNSNHRDLDQYLEYLADLRIREQDFVARKNFVDAHR